MAYKVLRFGAAVPKRPQSCLSTASLGRATLVGIALAAIAAGSAAAAAPASPDQGRPFVQKPFAQACPDMIVLESPRWHSGDAEALRPDAASVESAPADAPQVYRMNGDPVPTRAAPAGAPVLRAGAPDQPHSRFQLTLTRLCLGPDPTALALDDGPGFQTPFRLAPIGAGGDGVLVRGATDAEPAPGADLALPAAARDAEPGLPPLPDVFGPIGGQRLAASYPLGFGRAAAASGQPAHPGIPSLASGLGAPTGGPSRGPASGDALSPPDGSGSEGAASGDPPLGGLVPPTGPARLASAAPEPQVWVMMVAGIGFVGVARRRARKPRSGRAA